MIATLGPQHVDPVARIHCACLTGLLTRLGYAAARAFYQGCAGSDDAVALVHLNEAGLVDGFVLGSPSPARLRRESLRRNWLGTLWGLLVGVLRRPATLTHLAASFTRPRAGDYNPEAPELTYLVVAPESRGSGAGYRLVKRFGEAMWERGIPAYELSVDEDNHNAIRFYEKLGFELLAQYREFGILHRRYRLHLSAPDLELGNSGPEGRPT